MRLPSPAPPSGSSTSAALVFIVLLVAPALAGCFGPTATPAPRDDDAADIDPILTLRGTFVNPIDPGHDHGDLAAHALSTPTMQRLGYSSLGDDAARFTSFGEMDWHGDLMVVAAQQIGETRHGAIVLVDISDPTDMKRLGFANIRDTSHPLDVKFEASGEFVYAVDLGQIYAFDVRDPANPRLAGAMLPPGAACHMSATGVVAGKEYFFCTGDPAGLTIYEIVSAAPNTRAFVPVGYTRPDSLMPVVGGGTFGVAGAPHDMTFQQDPVDDRPLLVVSNRGFGVRVLDVSNPSIPVELGSWHGENKLNGGEQPRYWSNHMHTAMVTMVDGERILIVTPEILEPGYPPSAYFLDAKDYGALTLVAEWWTPGEHPSPGFLLTMHQWQVAEGRMYLGYYHAGVWVLDIARILAGTHLDDEADHPEVLGYYLPHESPVEAGGVVPNVWDVTLRNGVIFVTDIPSGLYALNFAGDAVGDERITGFS